ncbi:hypothetical protein CSKR_100817 [Clonorchis sinensis]|uniref:Uncharacterized protein n=1 Tax=Clonorchis sinensis TaxID=79923 RepID=A0A419QG89_CLOSI|nr:hypothetical protein CSKR_100817 [Clonorchis sinensis]
MSPKRGETGCGLSKNFQQPYEWCITSIIALSFHANFQTNCSLHSGVKNPPIKETTHKVTENSSTAHDRFRPSWDSSACAGGVVVTHVNCPEIRPRRGQVYALLVSPARSKTRVQCFPRLSANRLEDHKLMYYRYSKLLFWCRSAVTPFWRLAAMPTEEGRRTGILPSCPSLDRSSRDVAIGFEPQIFRDIPLCCHRCLKLSKATRALQIRALTSPVKLQSGLIQLPRYVERSKTSSTSSWIVHTKGRDDFGQFIQKHLRLLLFEDENDVICIFHIDKVFVTGFWNTGIVETFQRSSHDLFPGHSSVGKRVKKNRAFNRVKCVLEIQE